MLAAAILATTLRLGPFLVQTHACPEEPFCKPILTIREGRRRWRFEFFYRAWPGELHATPIHVPGVDGQLLVVVAVGPGGSDTHFETAILRTVPGKPPEELIERLEATTQNAICAGQFGGIPGVVLIEFLWEDEAHYQPHRYQAILYRWNGARFTKRSQWETRQKHPSWREASRELGLRCSTNFVEHVSGSMKDR